MPEQRAAAHDVTLDVRRYPPLLKSANHTWDETAPDGGAHDLGVAGDQQGDAVETERGGPGHGQDDQSARRDVTDAVVPSKLLAYLAAARPVLAAVNPASAAATILTASGGGILVPPEEPAALAGAIRRWRSTATDHSGLAQRARSYVLKHYGRQNVLERYRRYLEGWAGSVIRFG